MKRVLLFVLIFYCLYNSCIYSFSMPRMSCEVLSDSSAITACVFLEFGSCVKCIIYPEKIIKEVAEKTSVNIRIVGYVNCGRAKEIVDYKSITGWKYEVEPDVKRTAREKLGCKPTTDICLINSKGRVIAEIENAGDYKKNVETLVNAIKKE